MTVSVPNAYKSKGTFFHDTLKVLNLRLVPDRSEKSCSRSGSPDWHLPTIVERTKKYLKAKVNHQSH